MRIMTIEDYDKVYALWLDTDGMDLNEFDESRDGIMRYLDRNPGCCFVEEDENGEIIGAILSGHDGRRGSLHHLSVKKGYRNKGIGKKLVEAAVEALKKEGINRVALFVYTDNIKGIQFWKKLGFILEDEYVYLDKDLVEIKSITTNR